MQLAAVYRGPTAPPVVNSVHCIYLPSWTLQITSADSRLVARTCGWSYEQLVALRAARGVQREARVQANNNLLSKTPYPFQLIVEGLCGFQELPFFLLVAVFNLQQLCLQLSLWGGTESSETTLLQVWHTDVTTDPTWWTIKDWTCRFRTCMRAVVTTERTSGTTLSLRISLIRRWLRWKRAAAVCFIEKPSS